jgi:hypothetical protein
MIRLQKLTGLTVFLVATFAVCTLFVGHAKAAAFPPPDVLNRLAADCTDGAGATGFVYPNPDTVPSSSGSFNLYSATHVCASSGVTQVTDVQLKMYNITRYSGTGNISASGNINFPMVSADCYFLGCNGLQSDPGYNVNFSNLSPGDNCWSFSMDMTVGASIPAGRWSTITIGNNNFCINYTPPDQPPIGGADANCDNIWGWAYDPDQSWTLLKVDIWIAKANGTSNTYYKTITASSGLNHNNFNTTNPMPKDGLGHIVHAYAINPNGIGPNTEITPAGGKLVGSSPKCDRPPTTPIVTGNCSGLFVTANDPDFANAPIQIVMYVDGWPGTGTQDPGVYRVSTGAPHTTPKISIADYADAKPRTFYFVAKGTSNSNGNPDPGKLDSALGSITVPACAPITCTVTVDPAPPEIGTDFSIILSYNYNRGGRGRLFNFESYGWFNNGPKSNNTLTSVYGPTGSTTFTGFRQNTPGIITYNGSIGLYGGAQFNCPGATTPIATKPYLKVFGNDIAVGGQFSNVPGRPTSCTGVNTVSPTPAIWTFAKKTAANNYGGGGAQFADFALGQNDQFLSAANRNGQANDPKPPAGLSFGNMIDGNSIAAGFGGAGGKADPNRCIPDYFSAVGNGAVPVPLFLSAGSNGSITKGMHAALFVDNDAIIDENVTYEDSAGGPTGWSSVEDIPSFYLIVRGDIYIDSSVTSLDGVYIAQKRADNTGGHIFTCTSGHALFPDAALYTSCQNKLTITGTFIANQVRFLRTKGTASKSIPDSGGTLNEGPNDPSDNIAEVFNFSQEMYLAPPPSILNSVNGGSNSSGRYDSITSLPPIL